MTLLLGIDGGNTKSIALIATPDGTIVGAGRSEGTSDVHAVSLEQAVARLADAADAALEAVAADDGAKVDAGITTAAFSLAGADWPEDHDMLERALRGRWPDAIVVNDAIGALRAAIPDGPGVVVVCGTGATTGARGVDGRTWHASFWQETQGAYMLGELGVRAIVRAELGIGPPTTLTERILAAFDEPTVEAVLHRLTGRATRGRREQASLASVVLDAAEGGDEVAGAIVRAHGADLGRFALAAARRVGIEGLPFTLALAGGVLRRPGTALHDALSTVVLEAAPATRIAPADLEPAAGALLLAFDAAGLDAGATLRERLRATMPAAELFDTHPGVAGVSR